VELLPDGAPCGGPDPARCGPCAAAWAPVPGRRARALLAAAGAAARWVDPDRLHRLYRRAPAGLRLSVHRGRSDASGPAGVEARAAAFRGFAAGAVLTAPSAYLARRASAQGLGAVHVVPHGCDLDPLPRVGGGPLLFLGSIAHHKGPDRVVRAWRQAFPSKGPPLALHGPILAPELALGHPLGGPLDRAGVRAALAGARALVMGSRWAENAPLVILEARAAGCPVVAPASGGIPELVEHGVDGLLFRPDDPSDLVRALRAIVAQPLTPRPPRRLSDQVDDYVALYDAAAA
jgi:glycosyltransferase involved in cell wall biosynthesis